MELPDDPVEFVKALRDKENLVNILAGVLRCKPEDITSAIDAALVRKEELEKQIEELIEKIKN